MKPNAALVAISIAARLRERAAMIYLLAEEWFGASAARYSGALFLVSPLAWFHGIVALTYMVEGFSSALIGYLCWRIYQGSNRWILPSCAVVPRGLRGHPAFVAIIPRPFVFVFLAQGTRQEGRRRNCHAAGDHHSLVCSNDICRWPGSDNFGALTFLWGMSPGRQNAFSSLLLLSMVRLFIIAGILIL